MSVAGVLIAIALVLSVFFYVRRVKRVRKLLRDVPSPPEVPLVGHVRYFKDPAEILSEVTKMTIDNGGFVKLHMFNVYTVLISNCKLVEELLCTTKIMHKSWQYEFFSRWLGSGLLTSGPDKWKKTRKIITPTFHFQILEEFIDVYNSAGDVFVEKLRKEVGKTKFDVYPYVTLCTLDVICETAMGTSVNAQKQSGSEYVRSVQEMSRIIRRRLFSAFKLFDFFYYLSWDYQLEKRCIKVIHDHTKSVIAKRKCLLEDNNNSAPAQGKHRLAFLDLLLQARIDGRPITDEEIREEVDTFMFEGHDTTSSAITFTLYCLSLNVDVQEMAVRELQEIFEHDQTSYATHSDLQRMRYLEMVIKESLRLYPSVPFYGRKLTEDTEFADRLLPKGITLSIFAYGLHRDPTLYPDPETFDPERFAPERQSDRNPFGYVPFSAGPRNCIGQKFAMLEMKALVSKVLRNYEVLPAPGYRPVLVPDLILKSLNGVEISLKERRLF